eukprot:CAMPEP_0178391976 /NCGR_PEP_ID=MMETSP0689_2-20121128/11443_1 /TAXON_ID=160604 /ORGANISM="Amphidinium massartii, Strain CS-259" /LENGTH=643 /DNA_ID=CAMNT_0020012541 /DNA_START=13 /DNA_END=1941 /DNA_ORIENTATION=+
MTGLSSKKPSQAGSMAALRALSALTTALVYACLLHRTTFARRSTARAVTLAIQAIAPLSFFVIARNVQFLAKTPRLLRIRRILWYLASFWAAAEVAFLVYMKRYQRHLNSQTTIGWRAIALHSTEEKRLASLERYLRGIVQVFHGASAETDTSLVKRSESKECLNKLRAKRTNSEACLQSLSFQRNSSPNSSTSNLRLAMNKPKDGGATPGNGLSMLGSGTNLFGLAPQNHESVSDLLKLWDSKETEKNGEKPTLSEDELLRLKWLELAGWFHGRDVDVEDLESWLRRGNVEDWIAHYWFRGATSAELRQQPRQHQELNKLVDYVLQWAGLPELEGGRNPNIHCYLLYTDPLPVAHRPLLVYGITSWVCPIFYDQVMTSMGFRRQRVGGLIYYHRPKRSNVPSSIDLAGKGRHPMVYIHGLGVALLPYLLFIHRLSQRYSGELYVPILPFLAMQIMEIVPSAREVVAQMQDMLAAGGHRAAHFAGHSFGCVVIGWMLKMSPSSVYYTTLMEPAMFLMFKCDIMTRLLYNPTHTAYEHLIRYFAFRELFTVNLLARNSFWEVMTVWPEDIISAAVVELGGADHIVDSHYVKRLLDHERMARRGLAKQARRRQRNALVSTGSSEDLECVAMESPAGGTDSIDILW